MAEAEISHVACGRFFAIPELVSLFLEHAPTLVLINCTGVCKQWASMIANSQTLQENLFQYIRRVDRSKKVRLNPILCELFGPMLWTNHGATPRYCTYEELSALPWARDGQHMDAKARIAFARREASWRAMLVSQPPISRLDWWHIWDVAEDPGREEAGWPSCGGGHQDLGDRPLQLGLLYDLVEARLRRGCRAMIQYFPEGQAVTGDRFASEHELEWAAEEDSQRRFTATEPRVKITTEQTWDHRPSARDRFDMAASAWKIDTSSEIHVDESYEGDGFNLLRQDCQSDYDPEDAAHQRWSKSDAFAYAEIHGNHSWSQ